MKDKMSKETKKCIAKIEKEIEVVRAMQKRLIKNMQMLKEEEADDKEIEIMQKAILSLDKVIKDVYEREIHTCKCELTAIENMTEAEITALNNMAKQLYTKWQMYADQLENQLKMSKKHNKDDENYR